MEIGQIVKIKPQEFSISSEKGIKKKTIIQLEEQEAKCTQIIKGNGPGAGRTVYILRSLSNNKDYAHTVYDS